jgi:HTH-type transcriptional regulator, transcriptional repressor of NAD biosynthesis genes
MTRGVVIGKFYPPHLGHSYLIETALSQIDHLDVIVCVRPDQSIPGSLRSQWLKHLHPRVNVIEVQDFCDDDNSTRWAQFTVQTLGYRPDLVFTSENYGEPYAHAMDAKHVMVDLNRVKIPIAASVIRAKPLEHLEYLAPIVRAFFVKRVCLVGAESTGTTTMSRLLAEKYNTIWVPEYGREYYDAKVRSAPQGAATTWESPEFIHIAYRQLQQEEECAGKANRVLICDTAPLATSIWHERYLGRRLPDLEPIIASCHYDLYLLTNNDIPFVQDGTRDGEHLRKWMTERFRIELEERRLLWTMLSGTIQERLLTASAAIDPLLR